MRESDEMNARRKGEPVPFGDARAAVFSHLPPLLIEPVNLLDALGRVLAEDVYAEKSHPPLDLSLVDGIALAHADVENASPENPVRLEIKSTVCAGDSPSVPLEPGTCVGICTGAPIPAGADCVVPGEEAVVENRRAVFSTPCPLLRNIRQEGEYFLKGDMIAPKGRVIRPEEIHALASLGRSRVRTFKPARVALISTGSELVDLGSSPVRGQLWASNIYYLAAYVRLADGLVSSMKIVPDDPASIARAVRDAQAEIVVTTGGTATGARDFMGEVLSGLGAGILFERVAMSPGKSFSSATLDGRIVFCFPGSPGASQTLAWMFLIPSIRRIAGHESWAPTEVVAVLEKDISTPHGLERFIPSKLYRRAEGLVVKPISTPDKELYSPSLEVNSLVVVPSDVDFLKSGFEVRAMVIGEVDPEAGEDREAW